MTQPLWTTITFGVVLLGLPVYYLWFAGRKPLAGHPAA
jgi:hypothetical protein